MREAPDNIICPSCSSPRVQVKGEIPPSCLFAGRTLNYVQKGGRLCRCPKCHLLFRHPLRSTNTLNDLYRSENEENWSEAARQRTDWCLVRNWLGLLDGIGRVLDVGCFDGRFLEYIGHDYQWFGVEINDKAAWKARMRGVQIVGRDFTNLPTLKPLADLATAIDIIEHCSSPSGLLGSMAACVRPGGYIVITTGNTEAPTWRFMGSTYWYCHIAEHVSFINPSWARHIAPLVGLDVQYIHLFSHADPQVTILYKYLEVIKNITYKISPALFALLRRGGMGGIDLKRFQGLALSPPNWMSAKDHMLIVFRKLSNS
jgi:SAM-dependent methyltransferase